MRFINKDPEGFGMLFSFEFLNVCERIRFSVCGHCNIFNLMLTLHVKGQDSLLLDRHLCLQKHIIFLWVLQISTICKGCILMLHWNSVD